MVIPGLSPRPVTAKTLELDDDAVLPGARLGYSYCTLRNRASETLTAWMFALAEEDLLLDSRLAVGVEQVGEVLGAVLVAPELADALAVRVDADAEALGGLVAQRGHAPSGLDPLGQLVDRVAHVFFDSVRVGPDTQSRIGSSL